MANLPARCEKCGKTIIKTGFNVGPGSTGTSSGNTVSCPCGGMATVAEGTFHITDDDEIEVVEASKETREWLAGL